MSIENFIKARDTARKLAMARKNRLPFTRRFLAGLISSYAQPCKSPPVKPIKHKLVLEMGRLAASMDAEMAAYLIGTTYTVMLPEDYRSRYGVFYTPPVLASRLLDLAESAGTDFSTAKILDPACGGGAFLAPLARRMATKLSHLSPIERLRHIETHLHGYEIDPFSAWVSQVLVEMALKNDIEAAGRPLAKLVDVCDSLQTPETQFNRYDLVIGNPPYGRIKLEPERRAHWARSLYGHANLYGLFTDLAVRLVAQEGIIAFVTPTSFLGGQYFQALRGVLGRETPPVAFDFVASREGVFADALQEAMLAVYRKQSTRRQVAVSYLSVRETGQLSITRNGDYPLPEDPTTSWILPRKQELDELVRSCSLLTHRLADLGYTVATGPLVWNRHKEKLHQTKQNGCIPLIWAECINSSGTGEFSFSVTSKNHSAWFKPGPKDEANIVREPCVLLQRTTSLEQPRRLIAAELPKEFIDAHGGAVTIENHVNMVRPIKNQKPIVSARVIAALLNTETVDQVFRCINGSTAVSAYELESMPLPPPEVIKKLEGLIANQTKRETIEKAVKEMYANVRACAAA